MGGDGRPGAVHARAVRPGLARLAGRQRGRDPAGDARRRAARGRGHRRSRRRVLRRRARARRTADAHDGARSRRCPAAAWTQHEPLPWTLGAAALGVAWLLAPRGVPGRALGALWLLPLFVVLPRAAARGRGARHRARRRAGARGRRPDASSRARLRHGPALARERRRRLAHRRAVPARATGSAGSSGSSSATRTWTMPAAPHRCCVPSPVERLLSSLRDGPSAARRAARRVGRALRRRASSGVRDGVDFAVLHPPASLYADPRARTNDLSCVVRVDCRRRERAARRRHRGAERSAARARGARRAGGRRAGRAAPREPDLVDRARSSPPSTRRSRSSRPATATGSAIRVPTSSRATWRAARRRCAPISTARSRSTSGPRASRTSSARGYDVGALLARRSGRAPRPARLTGAGGRGC